MSDLQPRRVTVAMTEDRDALARLLERWRQVETWGDGLYPPGDEASAYEAGIRKCADELEALLAGDGSGEGP